MRFVYAGIVMQLQVQAGTYIKVTTVPDSRFSDGTTPYRILYLRPSGTFLFLGYWSGFEHTSVVGRWAVSESGVELLGDGLVDTDCLPHHTRREFRRTLTLAMSLVLRRWWLQQNWLGGAFSAGLATTRMRVRRRWWLHGANGSLHRLTLWTCGSTRVLGKNEAALANEPSAADGAAAEPL